ncbi:MAG TPA: hypothetical protein VJ782_02015 [Aeromicrobium sp.]|nr:hypothetical protein [Aeromicrobium sp.]
MRPSVRPGAALLRRDATHLQVGTSPGVIIRDRPGLYPLLLSLDGVRDLDALRRRARREIPELDIDVADALAPLIAAGLVVDAAPRARPSLRVELAHDGPTASLTRSVSALLTETGVSVGPDADIVVILSSGEPDRTALGDAVRCRVTHLIVVVEGDAVRVGPLVVPGHTPCVGCTDLHRATWEPGWMALVPQFGRAIPHSAHRLTQHVAAVEVVATCLEFAGVSPNRGQVRPGQIRRIGPDRTVCIVGNAAFHPRCACALLSVA